MNKRKLYLVFVDLKTTFERISTEKLWKYLKELRVTKKLRHVIENVCDKDREVVRIKSKYSREFKRCKEELNGGTV